MPHGCRERFRERSHLRYHVNDGRSLGMVADRSIDFAFSFDSLVHVELPVLEAYLHELARVLTPDGVAFLHHSNLGAYGPPGIARRWLPDGLCMALMARGMLRSDYWRAYGVSAELVRQAAEGAGMPCLRQEVVNWGADRLIDCFTTLTPRGSRWQRPTDIIVNRNFMAEAQEIRHRATQSSR